MASQDRQLLIDLSTNYPDVLVVIGKTLLGKSSRKKKSSNQKTEKVFAIAVCALLNSGGGILRMESEDRNYFFWEHGICEDIEMSLRYCTGRSKTHPYFAWMQQGSNLLLFVKTWSSGGPEELGGAATKLHLCSLTTGLFYRSSTLVYPVTSREAPEFLKKKNCAKSHNENVLTPKRAQLSFEGGAKETPLNIQEHNIQDTMARLKKDEVLGGEILGFTEAILNLRNAVQRVACNTSEKNLPKYVSTFANTEGGYLFFGVDDNGKVTGTHSNVEKVALEQTAADAISSMCAHHFCGSGAGVQIQMDILGVYDQAGCSQGYACAKHIELSCCPVFDGDPQSWMALGTVREESVGNWTLTKRLSSRKWMELMKAADPDK